MAGQLSKTSLTAAGNALSAWYDTHRRKLPWRGAEDPYAVWVSEVMLQQTQVTAVIPYYKRFLDLFPDVRTLAAADLQSVLKAWEGMGYYARARNLRKAAGMIVNDHAGMIPDNWADFRKLPGVGDYIAAAVLSIAFDLPFAVVDGNVKRVLARMMKKDDPVNASASHRTFQKLATDFLDPKQPGAFNQAVMELGALVCTPKTPDCGRCPVQKHCLAFRDDALENYPKRLKKKAVPQYHMTAAVIRKNGRFLITRRKNNGLLGGLWEFPGGKVAANETPESALIRNVYDETNLRIDIESHLTQVKHAYTHFKIKMDVYTARHLSGDVRLNGPVDYKWIRLDDIDGYPFPRANLKFIPILRIDG